MEKHSSIAHILGFARSQEAKTLGEIWVKTYRNSNNASDDIQRSEVAPDYQIIAIGSRYGWTWVIGVNKGSYS